MYFTDRSRAVQLTWFSVLLVLVSVSVMFSPSISLDDLVKFIPSGKELLIRFIECFLRLLSIFSVFFPFWF